MSSETPSDAPRVDVALPQDDLRRKVLESLGDHDIEVERVSADVDLSSYLSDGEADVIVLRRRQLSDADLDTLRERALEDDAPGVIVLSDPEQPNEATDRAELVAAGASRVLESTASPEELSHAIAMVADAESEGGTDGPERIDNTAQPQLADFLSRSNYMQRFLKIAQRVADADSSLLITGETGVGKERLARAIHGEGPRSDKPFITVNCGALPESLLESELFGHEKGAFTGATSARKGRFEEAQGGTIFLDEIGEMPAHMQVKLLSVLQDGRLRRVGGSKPVELDVRVMAATNRDVEEDIEAGTFRADLYYRLNVIGLQIPSLRERRDDIPDLVGALIRYFRESTLDSKVESISERALGALVRHEWPGNMRELINVIERACLLTQGSRIEVDVLPPSLVDGTTGEDTDHSTEGRPSPTDLERASAPELPEDWESLTLKDVRDQAVARAERTYLHAILEATGGKVGETAKRAGIGSRALYDRMKLYDLKKEDYRG